MPLGLPSALVSGFVGTVLGSGISLIGTHFQAKAQRETAERAHNWQVEAERTTHEREFYEREMRELRVAYSELVFCSDSYAVALTESRWIFRDDPEQKQKRINEQLKEYTKAVHPHIKRLELEPDSEAILRAFNEVIASYDHRDILMLLPYDQTRAQDIGDAETELTQAAKRLRDLANERIAYLKAAALH